MKKNLICLVIIFTLLFPIFSFNWGGTVNNTTAYKGASSDLFLNQTNKASVWFYAPVSTAVPAYIATDVFYEFEYSQDADEVTHIIDASMLKFNIAIPTGSFSTTTIDVGRFTSSDVTGLIISQPIDGLKVDYTNQLLSFNVTAGYTGFLNSHTVEMNVLPNEIEASSVYALASPFTIASATLTFPELFLQQNMLFESTATIDMKEKDNRIYASAAFNGPLSPLLFYTLSSTVGMSMQEDDSWTMSNMSAFELFTFLPLSSMLTWKTVFATGDDMPFNTFTSADANIAETLSYTGNAKTGLIASMRPITSLLLLVNGDAFFNVMNENLDKGYIGAQWLFSTRWETTSDLHLYLTAGQYFSAEEEIDPYFKGEFKLAFFF